MKLIQPMANLAFVIEDNGDRHCFSYNSEVAAIINDEYVEYSGYKFDSPTSKRHKSMFRTHFGL